MKRVLTGQQIGLLGGPLYTTFKVLSAIKLAGEQSGQPLYWLETNDADFREISSIDYIDATGVLKNLRWNRDTSGYSSGYIEVDAELLKILDTFFNDIQQTEFTSPLRKLVMDSYQKGFTLEEASRRLAEGIFKAFDLTIFTPSDRGFRDHSKDILLKEAYRTELGNQCNLFILDGKVRKAVYRSRTGFHTRDNRAVVIEDYDLLPNVKTRNVCQDSFFDAYAYVAGPGEVKYIKELGPWYDFHQVEAAKVVPRISLTLIEPKVKRLLSRTGLTLEDILKNDVEITVKNLIFRASGQEPSDILKRASDEIERFCEVIGSLGLSGQKIGKNLKSLIKEEVGRVRRDIKEKHRREIDSVKKVYDLIKPYGKPQERVFNIFYYMNKYGGFDFVRWLYDNYDDKNKIMEVYSG